MAHLKPLLLFVVLFSAFPDTGTWAADQAEAEEAQEFAYAARGLAISARAAAQAAIGLAQAHPNYGQPGYEEASQLVVQAMDAVQFGILCELAGHPPMLAGDVAMINENWGEAVSKYDEAKGHYLQALAAHADAIALAGQALFILLGGGDEEEGGGGEEEGPWV